MGLESHRFSLHLLRGEALKEAEGSRPPATCPVGRGPSARRAHREADPQGLLILSDRQRLTRSLAGRLCLCGGAGSDFLSSGSGPSSHHVMWACAPRGPPRGRISSLPQPLHSRAKLHTKGQGLVRWVSLSEPLEESQHLASGYITAARDLSECELI